MSKFGHHHPTRVICQRSPRLFLMAFIISKGSPMCLNISVLAITRERILGTRSQKEGGGTVSCLYCLLCLRYMVMYWNQRCIFVVFNLWVQNSYSVRIEFLGGVPCHLLSRSQSSSLSVLLPFLLQTDGIQETFRKFATESLSCTQNWPGPDYTQAAVPHRCHWDHNGLLWNWTFKELESSGKVSGCQQPKSRPEWVYWLRLFWIVVNGPIWDWGWGGEWMRERKEPGSQESEKPEPGAVTLSHLSCCPGSDFVPSLMPSFFPRSLTWPSALSP